MMDSFYNIVYQKRKTIGIYITDDAKAEVRCPKGTAAEDIDKFVSRHYEWIKNALERKREVIKERENFRIGERAYLLGKEYPIKYLNGRKYGFREGYFYLPEGISEYGAKEEMICIYKRLAKNIILPRASEIAEVMGCRLMKIGITSARTRWGSCSGKNSINFSWRLVMASREAIDYVIIHELVHTEEHNHGKRFWELVEAAMPEYRKAEEELKGVAERLRRENW